MCPCRAPCWGGRADALPKRPERGGVSAPWIGERYFERRICILAMNFDGWGGLAGNWETCEWHREAQRRGERGKDGRVFALRAMAYAAVIDASLAGKELPDLRHLDPRQLVSTWSSCAFLQTVKCSPNTTRAKPFPEMFDNCPGLLLRDELRILAPRVVLLLGRPQPRDTVRPVLDVEWGTDPGSLERDRFSLDDGTTATLFSCNHPSTPNEKWWRRSLDQLSESVAASPL